MPDLKQTLKTLKLNESTVSVVLGALVVLVVGILVIRWFGARKGTGLISQQAAEESSLQTKSGASQPGSVHTVAAGENLWTISQKYFSGSGYNWVDIAKANKLTNPGRILVGQKLTIPDVPVRQPKVVAEKPKVTATITGDSYTTLKGDSLWKIAVSAYGDGYQWPKIYNANKAKIGSNPSRLFVGIALSVPR